MQFKRIQRWTGGALFAVALVFGAPGTGQALQVKPIIFDMSSAGSDSRKAITVTNSAATPVPMELLVNRLDLGPNGEMIKTPGGGEDFLIFPPQTIIPANSTQTFRIQWIGDPEIAESRSYNISVNQIPVKPPALPEDETRMSIQIVYSFVATVTVRPPQGVSSFQIRNAEAAQDKDGKRGVALTIENSGNLHNYLANAEVRLQASDWSRKLAPPAVRALAGPGLVLPYHTRRIFIPIDDLPRNPGAVTASITFKN